MNHKTFPGWNVAAPSFWQSMAAEKSGPDESSALCPAISVLQHNPKEVSKLMKKALFVTLAVFALAAMAMASSIPQQTSLTTDILGAHLGYGRGCIMCHAP